MSVDESQLSLTATDGISNVVFAPGMPSLLVSSWCGPRTARTSIFSANRLWTCRRRRDSGISMYDVEADELQAHYKAHAGQVRLASAH